jgi:hypothetical protein
MKNHRGQVLIILLFFIPPLLFLLFSVANTTLAVRDRLKLQNSADAAALSAAAWQAKGLNQIAEANTVIDAGALLEKYVNLNKPGSAKTRARLMVIEAEKKQMEFVKQDILKRLPGYAGEAAASSGTLTLTGETPPAGVRDDAAMQAADFGARAFGVQRDLKVSLGPDDEFDPETNRLFSVAWRKRALSGVAAHMFGRMAVPPGYALSSAGAFSEINRPQDRVLAADFKPGLVPVRMTKEDFDFFKQGFFFVAGKDAFEDVAGKILH